MDKIIEEIEQHYTNIKSNRIVIANTKQKIATSKPQYWEEATGIAKEKEDYVKSQVAGLNNKIESCEAEIEYSYNMINVLTYKMEFSDE